MSLLNLSTIPTRRKELEQRVHTLINNCDQITQSIGKLKLEAQSYVYDVNKCDPRLLKELYLSHMKKLDEYLYLVSDINTLLQNSETTVDNSLDLLPDACSKFLNSRTGSALFFDALSELPSSNVASASAKSQKREHPRKFPREDCLIYFSSASTSGDDLTACGQDDHELTNADCEAGQHASDNSDGNVNDNQVSSTEQDNDGIATDNLLFIGEFPDMPAFHCPDETNEDVNNNDSDSVSNTTEENASEVNEDSNSEHVDEVRAENAITNIVVEHNPEPLTLDTVTETGSADDGQVVDVVESQMFAEDDEWDFREMLEAELPVQRTLDTSVKYPSVITAINNLIFSIIIDGFDDLNKEMLEAELPVQRTLDTSVKYPSVITAINNLIFSIIIDGFDDLNKLTNGMNAYYNNVNKQVNLTREDIVRMKFCACGDETSNTWGRAFIIRAEDRAVEVFFVDSGEKVTAEPESIQPLHKEFYKYPPLSRSCQMAQLDSIEDNTDIVNHLDDQLSQFLFKPLSLQIEDDDSEFLAVTLESPSHGSLNELAVRLATKYFNFNLGSMPSTSNINIPKAVPILPEPEIGISDYPQLDDPLVAVTGYHNRDEADICKLYNNNPERGCRKLNCRKRHELMHPNGWTLDKEVVIAKHNVLPLPVPGTVVKVNVTSVWYINNIYVQIVTADNKVAEKPHPFSAMVPPKTLHELYMHMNNPKSLATLERLVTTPAPGEIVMALYVDHKWYRARILMTTEEQIKIMFVDYGTVVWLNENHIRKLNALYTVLPFQAVKARLVGYKPTMNVPDHMAKLRKELNSLIMDKELDAQVMSRSFDEIELCLYDESGVSIAERLYDMNLADLVPCKITDDSNVRCQVLPG